MARPRIVGPGTPNESSSFPFSTVDPALAAAAFAEHSGRPEEDLAADRSELLARMQTAFREAGAYDGDRQIRAEKIREFGEGNGTERSRATREAHARLAGLSAALNEAIYRRDLAAAIEAANSGGSSEQLDFLLGGSGAAGFDGDGRELPAAERIGANARGEASILDALLESPSAEALGLQGGGLEALCARLGALPEKVMGRDVTLSIKAPGIVATLLKTGTSGLQQDPTRETGYVPFPTRMPTLLDRLEIRETNQAVLTYMEQTTFTNAAAPVEEGDAAAQATLAWTERQITMRDVAVHIPLTKAQMQDVPEITGAVEFDLPLMTRQTVEAQVIGGADQGQNFRGLASVPNKLTKELAVAANVPADVINNVLEGAIQMQVEAYRLPDLAIMHPYLWLSATKEETTSAGYYGGNPFGPMFSAMLWGIPVITQSDVLAYTSGAAADGEVNGYLMFAAGNVLVRVLQDLMITWGWANDDFIRQQFRALCSIRANLQVRQPKYVMSLQRPA